MQQNGDAPNASRLKKVPKHSKTSKWIILNVRQQTIFALMIEIRANSTSLWTNVLITSLVILKIPPETLIPIATNFRQIDGDQLKTALDYMYKEMINLHKEVSDITANVYEIVCASK